MYEIYEQLLQKHEVSTYRVCKDTGIPQSVISAWKNGISTPKQDKLQKIADYFGVSIEYLMTGEEAESGYYLKGESAELAQAIFENKDLRILLDAGRNVRPEDLKMLIEMAKRLKATNPDG